MKPSIARKLEQLSGRLEELNGLLASGEATTPLMGKRAMHNWVAVPLPGDPSGVERWRELLGVAVGSASAD